MGLTFNQHGKLPLPIAIYDQLIAQTERAGPHECCGLFFGREGRINSIQSTENTHPTPQTHFEIDPQALIDAHRAARAEGSEIIGYYHSHPIGDPHPSATDQASAAGDGSIWAIIAGGEVKFWRDLSSGFVPLSYTLISQ